MYKLSVLTIGVALVVMASCGKQSQPERYDSLAAFDYEVESDMIPITRQAKREEKPLESNELKQSAVEKKIIKDGTIDISTEQLAETKLQVDSLVKKYSGYYDNENFDKSDRYSIYRLTIRIPNNQFEAFIASIENGDNEITSKEIDARDVTDEFIDLETRLENKRKYLQRYRELLNKANTVSDILEIQEKIRRLEEEIESTTGRLKYLTDQVDYSTLRLNIMNEQAYTYKPSRRARFAEDFKQSLSKGWFLFVDFCLFLLKLWPFWFVLAGIIYLWRKFRKKRKLKK